VDSRRVVVDVERGRTVPNWRPMRLGGGLGLGRFSGDGADHKLPSRYIHCLLLITWKFNDFSHVGQGINRPI
jgi:hypothetical protein